MSGCEHSDEWLNALALPSLDDDAQHDQQHDHRSDGESSRSSSPTPSTYPSDFSCDETAFAETFRDLFAPEHDDTPPDLAQTLLGDERSAPTLPGYEQKITYQVMRRLNLPRRPLFEDTHTPSSRLAAVARVSRRPLAGVFAFVAMLMIGVMVLSAPAFAAGVQLLAGHTGVQQTQNFPTNARIISSNMSVQQMSLLNLQTPISWLGSETQGFTFENIQLYKPVLWSNGPIVDVQYSNVNSLGDMEMLDIREFQISSKYSAVLQAVHDGSATLTQVGATPAVFVDGGWTLRHFQSATPEAMQGKASDQVGYVWQTGIRSELMFEQNGVVFWMTLNDEPANSMQFLTQLAQALTPLSAQTLQTQRRWLNMIGLSIETQVRPYPNEQEAYYLVPAGASANSGVGAFVRID